MTDAFRKVTTGQPLRIPAAAYNAFVDAAINARRLDGLGGDDPSIRSRQTQVRVVNTTGGDLGPRSILGIKGALVDVENNLDDFLARMDIEGEAPLLDKHTGNRFVVTLDAIPDQTAGWAVIDGICALQILARGDMASETILYADIDEEETAHLIPAASGAQVLWIAPGSESETEELRWAIVRLGGGAGDASALYKIVTIENDYLVCHTWNVETEEEGEEDILIAKPWMLQHNLERYAHLETLTTVDAQMVSIETTDAVTADWMVVPAYAEGDLIQAVARQTGIVATVDLEEVPVVLMDMNHDARAWAEVQPISEDEEVV